MIGELIALERENEKLEEELTRTKKALEVAERALTDECFCLEEGIKCDACEALAEMKRIKENK